MRNCATFVTFVALCAFGCANDDGTSQLPVTAGTAAAAPTAGTVAATAGTVAAGPTAGTAPRMPTAGTAAGPSATAGTTATGAAGTSGSAGTSSSAAAGSGAAAGTGAAGTTAATAGSGGGSATAGTGSTTPKGSFKEVYEMALHDMCFTCHTAGGIFGSPDLSTPEKAYETLVNKDASTMAPGQCGGMGKLITPGNCETSILWSKLTQNPPKCGRRMPLSSDTAPQLIPQPALDALCAWIKAGAKKDP